MVGKLRLRLDEKIEAGEAMPLVTLHGSNGNADLFMKGYGLFCEVYGDNFQQIHKSGCNDIYHRVENPSDESLDVQLYREAKTNISQHSATTSTTFRKSVGELVMIMLQAGYTVETVVPETTFRF